MAHCRVFRDPAGASSLQHRARSREQALVGLPKRCSVVTWKWLVFAYGLQPGNAVLYVVCGLKLGRTHDWEWQNTDLFLILALLARSNNSDTTSLCSSALRNGGNYYPFWGEKKKSLI